MPTKKSQKKIVTKSSKSFKAVSVIQKRDGSIVPFDEKRIERAIFRALERTKEGDEKDAKKVMKCVLDSLTAIKLEKKQKAFVPNVEMIQDIVENELIASNFQQTAKSYILYRNERALAREKVGFVPEKVKELAAESKKYFRNPLAE